METLSLSSSLSYTPPPRKEKSKEKSSIFPFLLLPVEIRLAVYEHLLVRDPGNLFWSTKFKGSTLRRRRKNIPQPAILQANKLVSNEALEVLYSNNITALECNADETPTSWSEVIDEYLKPPSLRINTEFHPRLKYAAISTETAPLTLERPDLFDNLWVLCEPAILASCPNLELLIVHLPRGEDTDVDMVRRGSETASKLQKLHKPYRPTLQAVDPDKMNHGGKFCESLIWRHQFGILKRTAFKVGCVRWIEACSYMLPNKCIEQKVYFDDEDPSTLMALPSTRP